MDAMEKTVEGMKPLVDKGISMAQERFNAAKPALEKGMSMAQQGIDAAKPHVQSALNAAKPHVQSAIDAAKPAVQNAIGAAKPAVKNAFDAAKPHVTEAFEAAKKLSIAGMQQAGTMAAAIDISNPLPFPIPGTDRKIKKLSKDFVKGGGEPVIDAIKVKFAEDPAFIELAKVYADAGKIVVAERLISNFLLASKDPSPNEIKVSLNASLGALGKKSNTTAFSSASVENAAPIVIILARVAGALTLGLVGSKPLTKAVVKRGEAMAIVGAYAGNMRFSKLALMELEIEMGKRAAAKAVAANFLLAAPNPTDEEVITSLHATIGALLKENGLPDKTPKLTKELLTKTKGKSASAAICKLFATNATFDELAHLELSTAVEEYKKAYKAYTAEAAEMKASRNAAARIAENFLLAAPDPTEDEVRTSVDTTIDVLTRLG
jgi:hypothetical protein